MSNPELEADSYDVIVIGTGLAESIAAAALAKAGKAVLHLDPNDYYGASQASLTLDELVSYSSQASSSTTTSLTPALEGDKRRYALSLFPAVLPSRGSLIETLIKSDVSKYVSFRMLDSVSIWEDNGALRRVPGSKEDVFKDKTVGLADKRRLMKFLMFAAGDFEQDELIREKEEQPLYRFLQNSFSLSSELATSLTYAIAHCTSLDDPTLPALKRARRYLRSIGRYGSGALLVGQYGGAGEIAQGFCRACAVFGGTYVLGPSARPETVDLTESGVRLKIPCHPRPITAQHLVSSPEHLPQSIFQPLQTQTTYSSAQCIALLDSLPSALSRPDPAEGDEGKEQDDTAVFVFPNGEESVIRGLMMGEGTGSCPGGQYVLYLSCSISDESTDPSELLRPYLHRLDSSPIFEAYRVEKRTCVVQGNEDPRIVILQSYYGSQTLTEGLDWEAEQGGKAYWSVMGREEGTKEFFEKAPGEGEDEDDGFGV